MYPSLIYSYLNILVKDRCYVKWYGWQLSLHSVLAFMSCLKFVFCLTSAYSWSVFGGRYHTQPMIDSTKVKSVKTRRRNGVCGVSAEYIKRQCRTQCLCSLWRRIYECSHARNPPAEGGISPWPRTRRTNITREQNKPYNTNLMIHNANKRDWDLRGPSGVWWAGKKMAFSGLLKMSNENFIYTWFHCNVLFAFFFNPCNKTSKYPNYSWKCFIFYF